MISKSFDMDAHLVVHVDEDEHYLVETKQHVGTAHGFCRLDALDKSLLRDLMANNDYFAQQNPQTLTYGYDRLGQIEYASALVTVETPEMQSSCLALIGLQSSRKRVDGFFCRKAGQTIDASGVKAILSRINT